MSDTEREALARLLRAAAAVEKMLPHGPDRYELLVAAQEIAAGWRRSPQPDAARVAEIRERLEAARVAWQTSRTSHDCQSSACDHHSHRVAERAARTFGLHADTDIAYLLSLLGGDR